MGNFQKIPNGLKYFALALTLIFVVLFFTPFAIIPILAMVSVGMIILWCLPTVLNLTISYFIAKKSTTNPKLKLLITISISLLLTFNVRIPGMLQDFKFKPIAKINRAIELKDGEPISVILNGEKQIIYKELPLATYNIGGDEGSMRLYFGMPKSITSDIYSLLWQQHISFKYGAGERVVLRITTKNDNGVTYVTTSVFDGAEQTAYYENAYRSHFPFEAMDNATNQHGGWVPAGLYLTQSTIWNGLLKQVFGRSDRNRLSDFIDKCIIPPTNTTKLIDSDSEILFITTTDAKFTLEEFKNKFDKKREGNCDEIFVQRGNVEPKKKTYSNIISKFENNIIIRSGEYYNIASINQDVDKTICTDSNLFLISTGGYHRDKISISRISRDGKFVETHNIALPKIEWKGFPRKPMTDFIYSNQGYEFTLWDLSSPSYENYKAIASYRIKTKFPTRQLDTVGR